MNSTRRRILSFALAACSLFGVGFLCRQVVQAKDTAKNTIADTSLAPAHLSIDDQTIDWLAVSDEAWRQRLSNIEYQVLRKEGTERPFTSPLNQEKRQGNYVCKACGALLFTSKTKYDSGTGWPSFYDGVLENIGTKTDYKLFYPRTEYHCNRCGGHQGHVFKDGPKPTGLRYCNNGVALRFVPTQRAKESEAKASRPH